MKGGVIFMDKIRIVAEIDEDVFDMLCGRYDKSRVNIIFAEDATISKDDSGIKYEESEETL